jgi:hypothetical protein
MQVAVAAVHIEVVIMVQAVQVAVVQVAVLMGAVHLLQALLTQAGAGADLLKAQAQQAVLA